VTPHTANIARWYQPDGAFVVVDQPVCELETDNASADVPASATGILRHLAQVGDAVTLTRPFMRIDPVIGNS
jgi:2-oxoglutarate dehydrogenase E2 component (dihydrolipoamide succinyltransferase)